MPDKGELGWRLVAGAAAFGAGFVARKAITVGWKRATGKEPPANPESPEVALTEAIGWAVVMGVGMEVARLLATRAAAHRWHKSTGELPSALRSAVDEAKSATS
ncbi:DUF4235 domain-containing protein [Actinoallomurus sp. NPDC050550]|uniref:DUF4235 domain-containing protein n=1 Tax=Actinoallomurus sp. NPDC050550 TaxID=3154937 RepID=UPI0033F66D40